MIYFPPNKTDRQTNKNCKISTKTTEKKKKRRGKVPLTHTSPFSASTAAPESVAVRILAAAADTPAVED